MNTIPYDSTMAPIHHHRIIYFDKTMNWIFGLARTFSASIPNINCVNIADYGFDNQAWYEQSFGVGNQTGSLFTKVLYWDQATQTEVLYGCVDSGRANSILTYLISNGYLSENWGYRTLIGLIWPNYIEGAVVFSNTNAIPDSVRMQVQGVLW